jgi:hypothetical protein
MPTFSQTDRFRRDFANLTAEQKAVFRAAAARFVDDLQAERFRPGIRVKGVQGADGVFEMTWADDGWATFEYGPAEDGSVVREGETHIVWRRIGTQDIIARP